MILMKTEVQIEEGLRIVCLHHKFLMVPVMELLISKFTMRYDMLFDHQFIEGDFDKATLYDLTMWPKTNNPYSEDVSHKSLRRYVQTLPRQEMIGIKDPDQPSGVTFKTSMYYDECPLKKKFSSETKVFFTNIRL